MYAILSFVSCTISYEPAGCSVISFALFEFTGMVLVTVISIWENKLSGKFSFSDLFLPSPRNPPSFDTRPLAFRLLECAGCNKCFIHFSCLVRLLSHLSVQLQPAYQLPVELSCSILKFFSVRAVFRSDISISLCFIAASSSVILFCRPFIVPPDFLSCSLSDAIFFLF